MALQVALALAPTVLGIGSSIIGGIKNRKQKKEILKQTALMNAQNNATSMQMMQSLASQSGGVMGGMSSSYMGPSGMPGGGGAAPSGYFPSGF